MFNRLEKFLGLMVVLPPVYMLFRFLKWYIKQEQEPDIIEAEVTEG
ncbi:MAG TPA: hypothetical protein V6C76_06220 [Drouetiella sp.]